MGKEAHCVECGAEIYVAEVNDFKLYHIRGFYYAFYKTFLFSEECEAWVHGPVYREIYFRYRDYQFDPIEGNDEFDDSVFSSSQM